MANVSGRVIFDRDRSVTFSAGDTGMANIPVVLQNILTGLRLTVLTDVNGNYSFINVPEGEYRIVEAYGTAGGVPTPGNFADAEAGSVPQGVNPPVSSVTNPPAGTTNLDSVTPDTLIITVSEANVINQNFYNGPVIYTPIPALVDNCAIISGENLIDAADNGTFGAFPQGTPANTGVPTEPYPGVTPDFTYVLPNPDVYTPFGGEYTVQNIMNNALSTEIGAWWRIADHTEGNETGRMMIVNGSDPGAVFFRDTVTVQPNTNYLFTAWILNLFRVTGYPNPQLGVQILDAQGAPLYSATLGALIPVNTNAPEWKQVGTVINSQANTSLTVVFLSEGPEVIGNDYAIDDVAFQEILLREFVPVKTASASTASIGEIIDYTVTLTDVCANPLTNVFFQDIVPEGLTFVPGTVTVNGTLVPNADPNVGFALPDIEVGETASPAAIRPGERLTYTITASNAGPSAAQNVVLTDSITPSLTGAEFSIDGGTTFNPWLGSLNLGTLEANAARTILIRGVTASTAEGTIPNTATLTSSTPDPNPANNTSTINTVILTARCQALIDVVESIALQEAALARILNAEGEKMQAFIGISDVTSSQLFALNRSVTNLIGTVSRLEDILQAKLQTASCQFEECLGQPPAIE